jgi:prophage regulatory protein
MRLLNWDDLTARGITLHPNHLRKLIKAGKFPAPVKVGAGGRQGKIAFIEEEIDAWLAALIVERDGKAA